MGGGTRQQGSGHRKLQTWTGPGANATLCLHRRWQASKYEVTEIRAHDDLPRYSRQKSNKVGGNLKRPYDPTVTLGARSLPRCDGCHQERSRLTDPTKGKPAIVLAEKTKKKRVTMLRLDAIGRGDLNGHPSFRGGRGAMDGSQMAPVRHVTVTNTSQPRTQDAGAGFRGQSRGSCRCIRDEPYRNLCYVISCFVINGFLGNMLQCI
ncbi:hypothetical protein LZ32DRAFT_319489 [Colletotrichum eremochloae]|nr:hypothetical protein LZ32DRAFT_319489 [Colletotrichum eremochloae]